MITWAVFSRAGRTRTALQNKLDGWTQSEMVMEAFSSVNQQSPQSKPTLGLDPAGSAVAEGFKSTSPVPLD